MIEDYSHIKVLQSSATSEVALTDSTVLIRYITFPRFLGLLSGKFSFTALHALRGGNDPLEGRQITDAEVLITKIMELDGNGRDAMKALKEASPPHIKKIWDEKVNSPSEVSSYLAVAFHKYISERRAVSCWFANEIESAAMWSAFALHGVAIKTTVKKLKAILPASRDFLIAAIRYRDRSDFSINAGNYTRFPHMVLRPYLLKGLEFAHEKEVRVVMKCHEDEKWPTINSPKFSTCIDEVIISPYLDVPSARELKDLIKAKLSSLKNKAPINFSAINSIIHQESETGLLLADFLSDIDLPEDPLPLH